MKHINPGVTQVTTMAYDMVTENDNNISTEIKALLTGSLGWHDVVPETNIKQHGARTIIGYNKSVPATTLWKVNINPEDAIKDFELACTSYNTSHANDNPPKIARGKALAICNSNYDAVEIR